MDESHLKQTPFYGAHVTLGGKLIDFGGWALPVQYASILEEHHAVRERAGLFDVSHMGELVVQGRDAAKFLHHVLTNDMLSFEPGRCRYAILCYPDGGAVDDVVVYKRSDEDFLVIVNAANTDKDFDWLLKNTAGFAVTLENQSPSWAQLALQGPQAQAILAPLCEGALPQKNYSFVQTRVMGVPAIVSRTGYTGEDGFEVYVSSEETGMFESLLAEGAPFGLIPCGLGARDTLRFEAGMPLYGHELSASITPREAGLDFAVKLNKEAFIGRDALLAPPKRKRIGLRLIDRGIARGGGEEVRVGDTVAGFTTSGAPSPMLGGNYAMALVDSAYTDAHKFTIVVRKPLAAEAVPLPFYTRKK